MKWEEMTSRERDVLVAEQLPEWDRASLRYIRFEDGTYPYPDNDGEGGLPGYTTDSAYVGEVERMIEMRGAKALYIKILATEVCTMVDGMGAPIDFEMWMSNNVTLSDLWDLVSATPEQRCKAALQACGVPV